MLTPAQLPALKTFINATPALAAIPNTTDGAFEVAQLLNLPAVPDYFVWRTSQSIVEVMQNGFDWTRVDNLTVGKARIWEFMSAANILNPSLPNVRAGFIACFGTAGDLATRQAIFNHCERLATVAEKIYAVGSGTHTNDQGVGPSTMVFEGPVSYTEVQSARNLP